MRTIHYFNKPLLGDSGYTIFLFCFGLLLYYKALLRFLQKHGIRLSSLE